MSTTINKGDVEELLAIMEQWEIAELHLKHDTVSIDLVRAAQYVAPDEYAYIDEPLCEVFEEQTASEAVAIPAPVVGTFHLLTRGFPGGAPRVNDEVFAGQVIGNIELMHIPTDLASPIAGTIDAILAEEGAGVEYGQPILLIRPLVEVSEDETGFPA
ncbi:MAG: biotin/lipoyl-containing protein [bacterium]